MTNGRPEESRPSKNERREAAREKARILREEQVRRERRNRILLFSGLGVIVIAILTGVALIVVSAIRPPGPGPANMASDGIVIGSNFVAEQTPALAAGEAPIPTPIDSTGNSVAIRTYIDYMCPYCGQFETTNLDQIGKWVQAGAATLEIHPLAFLDRLSQGTKYSTRAANAMACMANYSPNSAFDFNKLLFENQPQESTAGLDNSKLKSLASDSGASSIDQINSCIDNKEFGTWVDAASFRAGQAIPNSSLSGITQTPTVLVNGQQYNGSLTDAQAFASFVLQVSSEAYSSSSTATPTPTPTPTH